MNALRQFFGLERNIIVMLIAVIAPGIGEEYVLLFSKSGEEVSREPGGWNHFGS